MASPFDFAAEPAVSLGTTKAVGVAQSDILVRGALVAAIADLRRHPYLLKYAFASLAQDDLTSGVYGAKEVARATEWFARTNVPVVLDYLLDDIPGNCITISLVESAEAEVTLGDVHYEPTEAAEATWGPLTSTFDAEYSGITGVLTLPDEVAQSLVVVPGMMVVTGNGSFEILSVLDRNQAVLQTGLQVNFRGAVIKGAEPRLVTDLESVLYKETYRIGARVHGEPVKLNWLYSILTFALLRYKQSLLEARGFERSVMTWSPFAKDERLSVENMWVRFVTLTGYVRHVWPKDSNDRIGAATVFPLEISKVGSTPTAFVPDGGDPDDALWFAESDGISTG